MASKKDLLALIDKMTSALPKVMQDQVKAEVEKLEGGKRQELVCALVAKGQCAFKKTLPHRAYAQQRARGFVCLHGDWFCSKCVRSAFQKHRETRKAEREAAKNAKQASTKKK